jgi:hypothetical protein
MDRYIGLDVHANSCAMVVLSQSGRLLRERVVETNGASLRTLRIERAPRQGWTDPVTELCEACVGGVEGRARAAVLFAETCEALSIDLVASAQ